VKGDAMQGRELGCIGVIGIGIVVLCAFAGIEVFIFEDLLGLDETIAQILTGILACFTLIILGVGAFLIDKFS
jgi:hypothetical protein